jgi:hypothetical protein
VKGREHFEFAMVKRGVDMSVDAARMSARATLDSVTCRVPRKPGDIGQNCLRHHGRRECPTEFCASSRWVQEAVRSNPPVKLRQDVVRKWLVKVIWHDELALRCSQYSGARRGLLDVHLCHGYLDPGASLLPGFHFGRASALATDSTSRRKNSLNFAAASGSHGCFRSSDGL